MCVCPPACPSVCLCEHTVEFRSLHVPLISDYVALLLMEEILHRLKWRTIICKAIFTAAKFLPSTSLGTPLRFFWISAFSVFSNVRCIQATNYDTFWLSAKRNSACSTMGYQRILMNAHEYLSFRSQEVLRNSADLNSIPLSLSSTFHGSVVLRCFEYVYCSCCDFAVKESWPGGRICLHLPSWFDTDTVLVLSEVHEAE